MADAEAAVPLENLANGIAMNIFFSVGEPSGDQHAAHLMQEMQARRSDLRFSGFGGPQMEQAGLDSLFRLTNLAVMGFFKVIPLLFKFYRIVKQAERYFDDQKPDAVILVDFPGFNWWIARKAKARGIPVFYFLPPQLWAWGPHRVERVRKFVDHVITALPFERDWYEDRGIKVDYVGHPFFDEVGNHVLDDRFVQLWKNRRSHTVAVLPGSRSQEVGRCWPVMIQVLKRLHARHPDVTFLVACYRDSHRRRCLQQLLVEAPSLPVQFFVGRTPEIIEASDCALMVSGSVSLEMMARKTPAIVLYRVSRVTGILGDLFLQCPFISLPNLIAGREVMPEFLSVGNPSKVIAGITDVLDRWIRLPEERQLATNDLLEASEGFIEGGAIQKCAGIILAKLPDAASSPSLQASPKAA